MIVRVKFLLNDHRRNNILRKIFLQGYNGSQLWDTAFTVQAIASTKLSEEFGPTLNKAHGYIKNSQVYFMFLEDVLNDEYFLITLTSDFAS